MWRLDVVRMGYSMMCIVKESGSLSEGRSDLVWRFDVVALAYSMVYR